MTIKVNIDIARNFTVNADTETVFALLSNVPLSASHFPKVNEIIELSEGVYQWEMEKVNLGTHSAQTNYACEYTSDSTSKTIEWTPVKGVGNAIVSGSWHLSQTGSGTDIAFKTKAELSLPLPGLLKLALSPLVKLEFSSLVDKYLSNLTRIFNA